MKIIRVEIIIVKIIAVVLLFSQCPFQTGGNPNNEDGGFKTFSRPRGFFAAFKIFFEILMMRTFTLPPRGGLLLLLEIGAGLLGETIVRRIDFVLSY